MPRECASSQKHNSLARAALDVDISPALQLQIESKRFAPNLTQIFCGREKHIATAGAGGIVGFRANQPIAANASASMRSKY